MVESSAFQCVDGQEEQVFFGLQNFVRCPWLTQLSLYPIKFIGFLLLFYYQLFENTTWDYPWGHPSRIGSEFRKSLLLKDFNRLLAQSSSPRLWQNQTASNLKDFFHFTKVLQKEDDHSPKPNHRPPGREKSPTWPCHKKSLSYV